MNDDVARGTTALVWGVAATIAFVALRAVVALGGHEPLAVDLWWHDLMAGGENDLWVVVAWVPAVVGGTVGMIVLGAALILWLLWRRRRADAATLAAAMVTVVAIGATMAAVIGRTRPDDSLAETMATSFPSGHTAVATTVVLVLALTFRRRWLWAAGTAWILLMMWSRTYLQAHWLSDVVAGMLEGVAVATIVWVVAQVIRGRRADASPTPRPEEPIESSTAS